MGFAIHITKSIQQWVGAFISRMPRGATRPVKYFPPSLLAVHGIFREPPTEMVGLAQERGCDVYNTNPYSGDRVETVLW